MELDRTSLLSITVKGTSCDFTLSPSLCSTNVSSLYELLKLHLAWTETHHLSFSLSVFQQTPPPVLDRLVSTRYGAPSQDDFLDSYTIRTFLQDLANKEIRMIKGGSGFNIL